ncbi:MAG: ornithine cyclodeaminase family protein [Eudoraea sp.]|nr:ornithine cyclodeaminase family protein [Eudoraea sp.]
MILIDSDTIGQAAPIGKWVEAMEAALLDTAMGKLYVPPRNHIDRDENSLFIMPCFGEEYFSTKLVSVFPKNLLKKKPVIYGTVVLNDGKTGKPLAALDGSKLTAMRTAAVGSVGIKYLADEDADSLGIIGLGIQGFHQALFACWQRPVKTLRILDRSGPIMERFAKRFKSFYRNIEVIPCKNALELCRNSQIIITATGSRNPVVPAAGNWWKGKTLIGIGSYKPVMREFPGEILNTQSQIFVDTLHGLKEAGDLLIPLEQDQIKEEQVYLLSDLISGKVQKAGGTAFFKSVGMAAFDLYGARLVYESQN